MLFQTLKLSVLSFIITLLLLFILLNAILGCGDWGSPNCVTPVEFIQLLASPFTE